MSDLSSQSLLYRSSQPHATMETFLWLSEDVMFVKMEDKVDGEESDVGIDKSSPLLAAYIFSPQYNNSYHYLFSLYIDF